MSTANRVVRRVARKGLVRLRDLQGSGVHPEHLRRLVARGDLVRVGRGLYAHPKAEVTELHSLAQVAARAPHGVVCLLTALSVHGLGTQLPRDVWLAIDRKAALPRFTYPPLRPVAIDWRFRDPVAGRPLSDHWGYEVEYELRWP